MAQTATLVPRQLLVHLGMSGSLQQQSYGTEKRKHDHLIIVFKGVNNTKSQLHYYDPRRFGSVLWHKDYSAKLLDHLGPEPLSDEFTADYLYQLIQRSNLLDHSADTVAIGNVKSKKQPIARAINQSSWNNRSSWVSVISMRLKAYIYQLFIQPPPLTNCPMLRLIILVDHIKVILQKAIALGGSTLRDFTVADGQTGYFQQTLNVYGRQGETCPHCDAVLENIKINGRAQCILPQLSANPLNII